MNKDKKILMRPKYIGKPIERFEDSKFLSGNAKYTSDINIDKMLQRIWDKMYLGFQRVYFNVWWRRVRKNYTVVRPKNSKYTVLIESRDLIFPTIEKKVLLDYSAYNDNIDGRQENEITTIPILYDNNNDNVTTSTSKYSKPALDDDFIKEFDTWLNSNEVRRKYQ